MSTNLADKQVKANIAYNYNKTVQYVPMMINSMLGAAKTPEEYANAKVSAEAMMNPKNFNLKPQDHMNMMKGLVTYRASQFDDDYIATMFEDSIKKDFPQTARTVAMAKNVTDPAVSAAIAEIESSGRSVGEDGKPLLGPRITNADGSVRMFDGKEDRAHGRFQVMRSTFNARIS